MTHIIHDTMNGVCMPMTLNAMKGFKLKFSFTRPKLTRQHHTSRHYKVESELRKCSGVIKYQVRDEDAQR